MVHFFYPVSTEMISPNAKVDGGELTQMSALDEERQRHELGLSMCQCKLLPDARENNSFPSHLCTTLLPFPLSLIYPLWLFQKTRTFIGPWANNCLKVQFSSVQLLSRVRLFATPWIAAHQASLSQVCIWVKPLVC